MKVSENFNLDEFIDPDTYKKFGDKSIWFIDKRVVQIAQLLRELIGAPVTINNWKSGGQYRLSGFRPPQATIGAKYSQHRFGRAIDVKVKGMTPEDVYFVIMDHKDLFKHLGLSTMEDIKYTKTWLHLDVRETELDHFKIVKP